jgi:hypothetical protein
MSRYQYVERPPTGGWVMEVRKGGSLKGNIRKNRVTGRYQFFRGPLNVIRPMLEESDMASLIERIEETEL